MFYISSRGSSATWWLAKSLSKHPKIVCFGSTRSLPPIDPGKAFPSQKSWINTIDPKKIAEKWKNDLAIDVGEKFKNLQKINYWHCKTTGFRWYDPKEAAGDKNLYEQLEKYEWYYIPT